MKDISIPGGTVLVTAMFFVAIPCIGRLQSEFTTGGDFRRLGPIVVWVASLTIGGINSVTFLRASRSLSPSDSAPTIWVTRYSLLASFVLFTLAVWQLFFATP